MANDNRQAWWLSAVLHSTVLLAFVVAAVWHKLFPPDEPSRIPVFELTSLPAPQEISAAPPLETPPSISAPEIEAMTDSVAPTEIVAFEPIPEPPTPPPTPTPTVEPQQVDPPKPKPKQVNYDDYVKENPVKQTKPVPRSTRPSPSIDTSRINQRLNQMLSSESAAEASAMTAAQQQALQNYISQLKARINAAWRKPSNNPDEWAEVAVTVTASGAVAGVTIIRHNASELFLNSVREAVRSTKPIGPTPTGKGVTATYTFRII